VAFLTAIIDWIRKRLGMAEISTLRNRVTKVEDKAKALEAKDVTDEARIAALEAKPDNSGAITQLTESIGILNGQMVNAALQSDLQLALARIAAIEAELANPS
jgi:hypothetical protein